MRPVLTAFREDLAFPAAAGTYACAIGAAIDETDTPVTYRLLRRSLADAGLAVGRLGAAALAVR